MAVGKGLPLAVVITAVDRFTAPFTRITRRLQLATAPLRAVSASLGDMNKAAGFPRLAEGARGVVSAVGDIGAAAQRSAMRIAGIGAAGAGMAFLFKRQFIDTASTIENLGISLEGITGSADKAKAAMGFIKKMTIETPFEMPDIASAFRTLAGFELDAQRVVGDKGINIMQAIVDQVAKIGGTGDALQGVALQLGQAWGKNKLQGQDIKTLIERGVPVWAMLARGHAREKGTPIKDEAHLAKIISRIMELSEAGGLDRKWMTLLFDQMGRESAGAGLRMMKTWTGMISNLSDQWMFFKLRVLNVDEAGKAIEGGLMDRIKKKLQGVLELIDVWQADGRLQQWADRIGAAIGRAFTWLEQKGPAVLARIVKGIQHIAKRAQQLADLFGGWDNLALFSLAAYIGGPLVTAVFGLTTAFYALGVAIGFTPVGWFLGVIAAIGAAIFYLWTRWPQVTRQWDELWTGMKETARGFLKFLTGEFTEGITEAIFGILKTLSQLPGMKLPVITAMYLKSVAGGPRENTAAPPIADRLDRLSKLRDSARRLREQATPTPTVTPGDTARLDKLERLRAAARRLREKGLGQTVVPMPPKAGAEPSQGPTVGIRPIFGPPMTEGVPRGFERRLAAAIGDVLGKRRDGGEASVTVTFEGTPPGTRVRQDKRSRVDLTLDVGYNLRTA